MLTPTTDEQLSALALQVTDLLEQRGRRTGERGVVGEMAEAFTADGKHLLSPLPDDYHAPCEETGCVEPAASEWWRLEPRGEGQEWIPQGVFCAEHLPANTGEIEP